MNEDEPRTLTILLSDGEDDLLRRAAESVGESPENAASKLLAKALTELRARLDEAGIDLSEQLG